ncbi:MAG TPA: adenylosuccinate synthase [Planctomycetota bacterium]|nr:adenylosuccinate synthase [Planctomycetota bacterium]
MPATSVIGAQWGDEGKGKIIDLIADRADVVVRFQGGANAGHTVIVDGRKYVFQLLPSGVLHEGKLNVIGNGLVVDPEQLLLEMRQFAEQGIELSHRLRVSGAAHCVMPYHKVLDKLREGRKAGLVIGTTERGIGPAYADKANRSGIRMWDLCDEERLRARLHANLEDSNRLITGVYGGEPLHFHDIYEAAREHGRQLLPLVTDTGALLRDALSSGKHVFFEGAQGVMLDIDHGTYPYVTSSNADSLGIAAGAGVPPSAIGHQIGVLKAYCTRVGEGPFPSELHDENAARLREVGGEFGAVTGRPRRCGWFDVPAARYASQLCGFHGLAITKLDVLSGLRQVGIVTAYELDGATTEDYPTDTPIVQRSRPVVELFPGWKEKLSGVRHWGELPPACRAFVDELCSRVGVPWEILSVGPGRESTIFRDAR